MWPNVGYDGMGGMYYLRVILLKKLEGIAPVSYPIQNRVKPLYTFFSSNHTIQPTYRPKRTFYLSYRAPRIILHFRNSFRNNTTNIKHYNFFIWSQFKSKHSTFSSYFLHSTAIIDDKQFSLQNKQHVAPELICFMINFSYRLIQCVF